MVSKALNPFFAGVVSGVVAAAAFSYFLVKALSPGLFGAVAISAISIVFGIFVGLSAFLLVAVMSLKKLFDDSCAHCGGDVPNAAKFCPNCGRRSAMLKLVKFGLP